MSDRAIGLPPLNATLAKRLMERTRIYAALKGDIGRPRANLEALEKLLVRFSQLVAEQPLIKEIDVNPLLASPRARGAIALNARMILFEPDWRAASLPKLVIRPGYILPENYAMQHICRKLGFTLRYDRFEEAMEAQMKLRSDC